MQLSSIREELNAASICVALLVALCIPAGYFWGAYSSIETRLTHVSAMVAAHAATRGSAEEERAHENAFIQALIDDVERLDGTWIEVREPGVNLLLRSRIAFPSWSLSREETLSRDGQPIGALRVAVPLQPMFNRVAVAAVFSFALAAFAFAVMRTFALKIVGDAVQHVAQANTELRHSNDRLREQTEKLSEAQDLGRLASWTYTESDGAYWFSPQAYALLGYKPESFTPSAASILEICQAEGVRRIRTSLRRALRNGSAESTDVKIKRGDGVPGYFTITAKPARNERGERIGINGTIQDITARALAEARLQHLAQFDPLTGLANRSAVSSALARALDETEKVAGLFALLLVDLDHFKDVNDTLGHAAGDELLVEVVGRIGAVLSDDDFFARLGGDEFAILVKHVSTAQEIEGAALRVLTAASGIVTLDAGEVSIGASIGIAIGGRDGRTPGDLLRNADLALYRSKEKGRGAVSFFTVEMDEEMQSKANLARDLRTSLASGEGLDLHYQPQVDLVTGRVVGFEALLRWQHPDLGSVPPSVFIPIAENSRLICDIGELVLRKATRQAKDWMLAGGVEREIAVNVSAAQIWHSDLLADVDRALAESGLPPHLLCLELTESLMADPHDDRVQKLLSDLKARGVMLALDDFGTGYSSLSHLSDLPFDKIKIDRVFVSALSASEHARELLKGIITLGRGLRMKVHVEGAESVEEIRTLCDFAADFVQGFAISRAVPADEAIAFARDSDGFEICEDMLDSLDDAAQTRHGVRSAA